MLHVGALRVQQVVDTVDVLNDVSWVDAMSPTPDEEVLAVDACAKFGVVGGPILQRVCCFNSILRSHSLEESHPVKC